MYRLNSYLAVNNSVSVYKEQLLRAAVYCELGKKTPLCDKIQTFLAAFAKLRKATISFIFIFVSPCVIVNKLVHTQVQL